LDTTTEKQNFWTFTL